MISCMISKKPASKARFQWLSDEDDGNDCYFEMSFEVDPMTKSVIMNITDFADEDEISESQLLWEQQVGDLKRVLGA